MGANVGIVDGKLDGIRFDAAEWIGGPITPEIVILHDTASRLDPGNAAAWLKTNPSKISVHFVVERNGAIVQQVPVNRRAGHAGKSTFHGRSDCNDFAIGIEIVNPGRMVARGTDRALTWWGTEVNVEPFGITHVSTPEHGDGLWMPYQDTQIEAVMRLLTDLFSSMPTLKDITTHWYVSPGRKVDTNPLFPLEHIRARVLGRDDPAEAEAETGSEPVSGEWVRVRVSDAGLNVRRWPSFNPNVIGSAPNGTELPVLRRGRFGGLDWLCVRFGGREGWIVARYTDALVGEQIGFGPTGRPSTSPRLNP